MFMEFSSSFFSHPFIILQKRLTLHFIFNEVVKYYQSIFQLSITNIAPFSEWPNHVHIGSSYTHPNLCQSSRCYHLSLQISKLRNSEKYFSRCRNSYRCDRHPVLSNSARFAVECSDISLIIQWRISGSVIIQS